MLSSLYTPFSINISFPGVHAAKSTGTDWPPYGWDERAFELCSNNRPSPLLFSLEDVVSDYRAVFHFATYICLLHKCLPCSHSGFQMWFQRSNVFNAVPPEDTFWFCPLVTGISLNSFDDIYVYTFFLYKIMYCRLEMCWSSFLEFWQPVLILISKGDCLFVNHCIPFLLGS